MLGVYLITITYTFYAVEAVIPYTKYLYLKYKYRYKPKIQGRFKK